ncbi:hypothetical protein FNV43_RR23345 [Rhamnella rubrinervis]|uniref:Uncharacterized protein n=1 Tax=Rhamnella rubrinervis TaxID=2594499 RepID=A0A8K0DVZ3_9ROSA|nr:hypothetical protein FNV43_RR23345 [Rhamnella rubrinervis]
MTNDRDQNLFTVAMKGATALQLAVTESQVDKVEELVDLIVAESQCEQQEEKQLVLALLRVEEEKGYTALHLAASMGRLDMCKSIAESDNTLEKGRRYFFALCHCWGVHGHYYLTGLAFKIIEKHEELVDSVNENGHTPLHVLATKSAAFATGNYHDLGRFNRFVYDHWTTKGKGSNDVEYPKHQWEMMFLALKLQQRRIWEEYFSDIGSRE